MKKLIKKIWLEALLSGNYKQGRARLKDSEGKYCCLGVLCDLHRKETNLENWDGKSNYYFEEDKYLPQEVIEWAELKTYNPINLGETNDSGASFEQIANIIEDRL